MDEGATWLQERTEVLKALALLDASIEGLREEAIQGLREDVGELRAGLAQLLAEVKRLGGEYGSFQVDYASRCVELESVRLKVVDLQKRMRVVEALAPAIRLVMWVGAALGVSVVALIWALITGQAQVMFR